MLAGRLARASACRAGGGRPLPLLLSSPSSSSSCFALTRRPRPTVLARGGPEIADAQRKSQLDELRELFKAYDTDGNGCVVLTEVWCCRVARESEN